MRAYPGIPADSLPPSTSPEFTPRLKDMLTSLDVWCRDASHGFARIQAGQQPNGSGSAISTLMSHHYLLDLNTYDDHGQYARLAGRAGGQILYGGTGASDALSLWPTTSAGNSYAATVSTATSSILSVGSTGFLVNIGQVGGAFGWVYGSGASLSGLAVGYGTNSQSSHLQFTSGRVEFCGARLDFTPNSTALVTFDAAAWPSLVSDSNDNLKIVRRSSTQTGMAIRLLDEARSNTLMSVDANGVLYNTSNGSYGKSTISGGGTAAAGVLGSVELTTQTASVADTTLLTGGSGTSGMYRVSVYLKVTTADVGAATLTATVKWNDGTAQSDASIALASLITANSVKYGSVVISSAASQNITVGTTLTKTNSPVYEVHARIEAL